MMIVLLGILDLARIYTTMMSVESAAREAADYGTTLGAGKWQAGAPQDATVAEMKRRACIAASDLPDYDDPDADPATGNCTNPSFACTITPPGGSCEAPAPGCEDPLRPSPCAVTVTLTYNFHLFAPVVGLPSTLTFDRDSTFAMTDIDLAPAPPGP